jgi:hypothetical protein
MITTTSLLKADIAFFPLEVPRFFFQIALEVDTSYEMIGYNFLPVHLLNKLHHYSAGESVTFANRPLEFVCIKGKYPYYENLNISDEYFSECVDRIMDTSMKKTRPITWVLGPSTLLFNISYSFSKDGLSVYRNAKKDFQKPFLIAKKEDAGKDLYRTFSISQLPLFKHAS